MGNNQPQLSFQEKEEISAKTGLPPTTIQGLHKRFFYLSQGKKGKDLLKLKDKLFGDDYVIHLIFTHGGFGEHLDKLTFKEFIEVFNKYSKHITGHNKTLKERIGWIWDFMVHVATPDDKAKRKSSKPVDAPALLEILDMILPEMNYQLKDAVAVIQEAVDEKATTIDRGSFIEYIGENIENCNDYMEIDYSEAFGATKEEIDAANDLFAKDSVDGLGDTADGIERIKTNK
jgi:hypothetical protein